MTIDEINSVIDHEIAAIGCKNQESVKGMLRIKAVINGADYIVEKHTKNYKYTDKPCRRCGEMFTPTSGNAAFCGRCRR